jgi:hypothetical protein
MFFPELHALKTLCSKSYYHLYKYTGWRSCYQKRRLLKGPFIIYTQGWYRRDMGWVIKFLTIAHGLGKNIYGCLSAIK